MSDSSKEKQDSMQKIFDEINKSEKFYINVLNKDGILKDWNYGFSALEVLGILSMKTHDIMDQIRETAQAEVETIKHTALKDGQENWHMEERK